MYKIQIDNVIKFKFQVNTNCKICKKGFMKGFHEETTAMTFSLMKLQASTWLKKDSAEKKDVMEVFSYEFYWFLRTAILQNAWDRLLLDFNWPPRQGCNKGFYLVLFNLLIQYLYLSIHIVNYSWYLATSYSLLIPYRLNISFILHLHEC